MTVIRPNSVSGITSITAQASEINVFRSDGALAGLQLNGVNFNTTAGVSTFATLNATTVSIGGTLTYEDVTNVDSVGVITARSTIDAQGDVSIADKIIHTGDTDTFIRFPSNDSFSVTTNNVTRMTFTGNFIDLPDAGTLRLGNSNDLQISHGSGGASNIVHSNTSQPLILSATGAGTIRFDTNSNERLKIDSNGYVGIKESSPHLYYSPDLVVKAGADAGGITIRSAATTHNNYLMFADGNSGDTRYDGYIKYNHSNRFFDFATATNVRLRITSTGLVGINETSPGTHLHVNSAGYDGVATFESTDANAHILIKDNNTHATGTYFGVQGNDFRWITHDDSSSAERLRLTKNGNIQHKSATGVSYFNGSSEYIFGSTTSSPPAGGFESPVQIHTSKTRSAFTLAAYNNNTGGPFMTFLSSRSTTRGTLGTKILSNDYMGSLRFCGDNATNYNSVAHGATIWARAKSTPGDGDSVIAGELHFATGTANAGSVTDNMVIQKDGQLDLKRGRVNDNGHMVYRGGGRIAGTATVSLDIPVLNDGNIYWIEAFYTHHSLSYGGYLYGVYGAYSGHSGLQINNTIGSSTAGGSNVGTWSVSRGSAGTPVVVAKSAGSYGGMGYYWIHVHAGNVSNL